MAWNSAVVGKIVSRGPSVTTAVAAAAATGWTSGGREKGEDVGSVGNTVAMLAERERIEGIRQIEVA